ncbi:MAG: HAMP domain-containing sensor histidine kinase [Pseudomonadota bacterium]
MIRQALRRWPVTLRVAMATGALMILLGLVASQRVLSTLSALQNERLQEVAQSHVDAMRVALGPLVLHRDIWEVYDTLDRAQSQGAGERIRFTAIADDGGRILASTDPARAPIDMAIAALTEGAVPASDIAAGRGGNLVRIQEPIIVQDREVGQILTELDVSDLVAQRRTTTIALLAANALATLAVALAGYFVVRRLLKPVEVLTGHMGTADGTPFPVPEHDIQEVGTTFAPLLRNFNGMLGAIDARREAEQRLSERERFVSLGRLSSSLAHEINNPLGGLLNATDTIRTYADRPEVVRDSAEILDRGLKHLRDVSQAILEENRRDSADTPLAARDFDDLKVLFEPEALRRRQAVNWDVADPGNTMGAFPAAPIRQISLNLLLNASAAAGDGGRVGFQARPETVGLDLVITDDGRGLSDQAKKRLLTETPLEPGGGVGLRFVRDLVDELGGKITHERLQEETRISVHFPTRAAAE